jgi:hypothetical protein
MVKFEPVNTRKQVFGHLLYFLTWVFVTVVGALLTPSPDGHGTHQQLGMPPCPSVLLYGRPCPGCGLTTSFSATVHGMFAQAFHAHPLGPIVYLLFTLTAFINLYGFVKKRRFETNSPEFNRFLIALTVIFFAFGVYRFSTQRAYLALPSPWWVRSR